MRKLTFLILILTLVSCSNTKNDFYLCAKKAGMFSRTKPFTISFDTIRSFSDFRKLSNSIRDTLSDCSLICGFVFNSKDSSFVPDLDTNNNIVIPAFDIISNHCNVDYFPPGIEIFMVSNDSVEIFHKPDNTTKKFSVNGEEFNKAIDSFYENVFQANQGLNLRNYINFVIPDTTDLNKYFLPCFRVLIRNYKNNYELYLTKHNLNMCDTSRFEWNSDLTQSFRFKLRLDDFDYRNMKIKFIGLK